MMSFDCQDVHGLCKACVSPLITCQYYQTLLLHACVHLWYRTQSIDHSKSSISPRIVPWKVTIIGNPKKKKSALHVNLSLAPNWKIKRFKLFLKTIMLISLDSRFPSYNKNRFFPLMHNRCDSSLCTFCHNTSFKTYLAWSHSPPLFICGAIEIVNKLQDTKSLLNVHRVHANWGYLHENIESTRTSQKIVILDWLHSWCFMN